MTISRCLSSQMMSKLLAWRNPQGREESWIGVPQRMPNTWRMRATLVTAELGLALLVATSIIETIAYVLLSQLAYLVNPISEKPYNFFAKLCASSSFTILWSLADTLIYNPFFINVMTHESFARFWASHIIPSDLIYRVDDSLYLNTWRQQAPQFVHDPMVMPIIREGERISDIINKGAKFIVEDVLKDASADTLARFSEMDLSLFNFILTKAVYIYTYGAREKDVIPAFFRDDSKVSIEAQRLKPVVQTVGQQLITQFSGPEAFEKAPENKNVRTVWIDLKNIASRELSSSILVGKCFRKACEECQRLLVLKQ